MEVKIEKLGKVSFVVKSRGHMVVSDQPEFNGGSDVGMTPPELLLASLGTCIGYYAAEFLAARDLPSDGLEIQVEGEVVRNPARIGRIEVRLTVPADLDKKHQETLMRTLSHCPIHNTLTHPAEVQIQVESHATLAA
jgi:uncharacterized OsmC-like protein